MYIKVQYTNFVELNYSNLTFKYIKQIMQI
jgi:hypothetical protein